MSYSSINSKWYTFWRALPSDEVETRDNAIFDIFGVTSFTAKELREDLESCLKKVREEVPEGDLEELKIYIKRFLKDVDEVFPPES